MFQIGLQRQREADGTAEVKRVNQPRRIRQTARRWRQGIEHRGGTAKEIGPMPAHEVDGKRSNHDDEIDRSSSVLEAEEVEVRALILGLAVPDEVEVLSVEIHTHRKAVAEQLRQLSRP